MQKKGTDTVNARVDTLVADIAGKPKPPMITPISLFCGAKAKVEGHSRDLSTGDRVLDPMLCEHMYSKIPFGFVPLTPSLVASCPRWWTPSLVSVVAWQACRSRLWPELVMALVGIVGIMSCSTLLLAGWVAWEACLAGYGLYLT